MVKSQKEMALLSEDELRTQVLIPLFKKMGFQDVEHYHGGDRELGKDIVMWKPGDVRERVNYGVVVKKGRISGKVSGRGSANEVRIQAEQLYATEYIDPVTTRKQRINQCFVVASGTISKEALASVRGILADHNLDRSTDFINGNKLWELVEKYLPQWTALQHLQQAHHNLEDVSPHWRFAFDTKGGQLSVTLEPKHPRAAEEQPIITEFQLNSPLTPEGQEAHKLFERFQKTGQAVKIDTKHVAHLVPPAILEESFGPLQKGPGVLEIGPRQSKYPLLVSIEAESLDGEKVIFDYIHLIGKQVGEEEITFSNEDQPIPCKFQIVVSRKRKPANIQLQLEKLDPLGIDVRWVLKFLHFQRVLAKGCVFRMRDIHTGFKFLEAGSSPGEWNFPDVGLSKLAENVLFIQEKTQISLKIPVPPIYADEIIKVSEIVQKLKTGRVNTTNDLTLCLDKEGATGCLEKMRSRSDFKILPDGQGEHFENVFEIPIPMGQIIITCEQAYVPEEDWPMLSDAIASAKPDENITVRIRPAENYSIVATYPKWLPETDSEKTNTCA